MRRYCLAAALAAVLLTGAWRSTTGQPGAVSPFPTVAIPVLPAKGDCCLWQTYKRGSGERRTALGPRYRCDTGMTARGNVERLTLTLGSLGAPCDQSASLIPNGSVLEATGTILYREDRFAVFNGRFRIRSGNTTLFSGRLELIDRVGTHRPPGTTAALEPCNPSRHMEGWLVGQGEGSLPNHNLRALIAVRDLKPTGPASGPVSATINGALIKCP